MRSIVIGTRGSDLALWQAHHVQNELASIGIEASIKIIVTKGDITHHLSFDKIEGKGFFTKELEEELLQGTIDLAVHSFKDLPTVSPEGLTIAAFSSREQPTDVLLIRPDAFQRGSLLQLIENAVVGTSSARRKMQVKALRPDLVIKDLRGNVPTRVQKLRQGQYDAIVLASAGLIRLNLDLSELVVFHLPPSLFVPAASQGVLALQTRETDQELIASLQKLQDKATEEATETERSLLHHFGGGCHMPLAIYASKNDETSISLRIAQANHPSEFPKRFFWPSIKINQLDTRNLPKLIQNWKPQPFFISRNAEQAPFFKRMAEDYNLDSSFISLSEVQSIDFETNNTDYEVVLFNSERAVRFFFASISPEDYKGKIIIAAGTTTNLVLSQFGLEAQYVCISQDFKTISSELISLISGKKCLVPCSEQTAGTISKQFETVAEVSYLHTYRTISRPQVIQDYNWYVFTSPSQVISFSLANQFNLKAHYFCLGPTTEATLKSLGIDNCHVSDEPTELSLLELMNTIQLHDFERTIQ